MSEQAVLKIAPPSATKVCKCCHRELSVTEFRKTKLGVLNTCKECVRQNQIKTKLDKKLASMKGDEVEKARRMRLEDFTPRQLMSRLTELGYDGKLTYTRTETIDLAKL